MGQLFNPRRMARTPGFIQDGVYDDLAAQDDYEQALPPPQQGGGLSAMLAAAPDAPLPPPRREYDGGPSVDPGPQARQRITLDAAPLPPKPSLMRQIIGTAAGAYLPQVGAEILAPGYSRKMREYNNNRQRMMDEGKLNVQAADEAGKWAHAGAEGSRAGAESARGRNYDARTADIGQAPIALDKDKRLVTRGGRTLVEAMAGEEKPPATAEAALMRAMAIKDPAERDVMLKQIADAHTLLNPEKPITQFKVGSNGDIVAVTVKPSEIAAAGGSKTVGKVAPKPVKASAASERKAEEASGDDVLIEDLASSDPRTDWNNLGVKEQNRLRPKLLTKGWTEPVKLSVKQKDAIETMNTLEPKLKEILDEYEKTGSIAGTGRFVGRLPEEAVTDQGQKNRIKMGDAFSMVAKLRSGGAIPEPEMVRLDAFLASQTRSDSFNVNALKDLLGSFKRSRESILKRPTAGNGQAPPPTGNGNPSASTDAVRMRHPNGSIRLVPAKDVAAAEAARYTRVK